MLNPFLNAPEEATNEAQLFNDLIVDAIQAVGINLVYMIRDGEDVNAVSEAQLESFKSAFEIEAQVMEVQNFSGEEDIFSGFGFVPEDTAVFKMAISRFDHEAKPYKKNQPLEGDVLFDRISNTYWEIRRVRKDEKYFIAGRRFCWIVNCAVYQPAHESVDEFEPQDLILKGGLDLLFHTEELDETHRILPEAEEVTIDETDFDIQKKNW